jgi:peptide/nickel transport system permease protein
MINLARSEMSRDPVVWWSFAAAFGFMVALVTGVAGVVIGATAGYFRRTDGVIMRLMDAFMAFPSIILAIAISSVLGASVTNVIIALAIAATPHTARIVRASVMVVREMEYVEAARALGAGHTRILLRHVLPNILPPVMVQATLAVAAAIIAEASLSFLGLGQQPPAPSWGSMLNSAQRFLTQAPWMAIYPGLAIILTVLAFNLFGDGLRDALDPKK